MLIQFFFVASFATEAERKLHAKLFDEEVYNPRVIQDSWRKANRNDFANIGSFAEDKCTGYNPPEETQAEPGSMMAIDEFATENPYKDYDRMERTFTCSGNQTIHIRLDPARGFETEKNWDKLTIQHEGYYKLISGTFQSLDSRFRQVNWYDLGISWLYLKFVADGSNVGRGFKFEIMCKDDQKHDTNFTKSIPITNEDSKSGWTKQILCVNSHETVSYRLKTELITDGATFDSTINKVLSVKYGVSEASFNQTSGGWIDTASKKVVATYNPPKTNSSYGYDNGYVNSYFNGTYNSSGDAATGYNEINDINDINYINDISTDYEPRSGTTETANVLFDIETKCQVRGK